jgi:hypothetical protein
MNEKLSRGFEKSAGNFVAKTFFLLLGFSVGKSNPRDNNIFSITS